MAIAKSLLATGIVLAILPRDTLGYVDKFDVCRQLVLGIIDGHKTHGDINNITIWERPYIYTGVIQGLDPSYSRADVLTLTYDGCVALCGSDVQLQEPRTALSMVATWIFPLAIVLSLPYQAIHEKGKIIRTIAATVNWLGSPQTALTATIHNFRQIREAHRRTTQRRRPSDRSIDWNDALYVLTCLNQYEITDISTQHLATLLYDLFRPTVQDTFDAHQDGLLTSQLLSQLAFQLRMLRRRAVIPTLASLATFLVAFVFSVVLSFAEVGESSSVDPLILGLMFSWLPVLVIFSIVDRNPVSADRAKVLMQRWLYNVRAVMLWRDGTTSAVKWWPPVPELTGEDDDEEGQPRPAEILITNLNVGRFIGQGRSTQYAGVSHAVMAEIPTKGHPSRSYPKDYTEFARKVHDRLECRRRPLSWFITALLSEAVVVTEVMLAFMLAFNTPTVGLGCWSGSFGIYAILSSLCWILSLCFRKPRPIVIGLCYALNALAFGWLITVTLLVLTGGMNTCYCQTCPFSLPQFGGYMTFVATSELRDMFNVIRYWATAAGFGLAIPIVVFVTAVFWWIKCAHLWKVAEDSDEGTEMMARGLAIDKTWLVS